VEETIKKKGKMKRVKGPYKGNKRNWEDWDSMKKESTLDSKKEPVKPIRAGGRKTNELSRVHQGATEKMIGGLRQDGIGNKTDALGQSSR